MSVIVLFPAREGGGGHMRTLEPHANAVMVHATTEMIRAFLRSEGILIISEREGSPARVSPSW